MLAQVSDKTSRHVASLRTGLTLMIIEPVIVGKPGENSARHLKYNSWPTPHPSVICMELLGQSRQAVTDRLATHIY